MLGRGTDLEQNFVHHTEVKKVGAACYCFPAWEHLFAEFDALANGKTISGEDIARDEDGTLWAAMLLFGNGDCEVLQIWGMPGYSAGTEICG